ncbi:acyltransferase family protein [Caldimonas thermodepolymerans]|uniref:acyltransferase family protein n=1 Tax=Caldimonas thermodepolymerans TaxID=215580 RepID=UPI0022361636|nr:acyltransferase family protein [Caldimonas thermodepolymerans]UZG43384.1 acyltransferase family protein [Caldimonas thermodepolymerans]
MTHAPTSRLYFLDWLRIAAFGVLVLYHVGMYYVSWDWHVKSPHAGPAPEPWMLLSSPWRLGLLFVVSGVATSTMLARDAGRGWLRARSQRLLLPLACGMLLVVPPQPYFEVVQQHGYAGGYLDFLRLYFQGHGGFCRPGAGCLILPTWNHLWFVAYLWVYTLVLWALVRGVPAALERAAVPALRLLRGPALLLAPLALMVAWRGMLAPRFPSTHALVDDWYNHAAYLSLFLLGAVLARRPDAWDGFARLRHAALVLALAGWAMLALRYTGWPGAEALRGLRPVAFGTAQWCGIAAAIGFARVHWDRDHAWRRYLCDAVFPVYLLHQTLIVLLTQALAPLAWPPLAEGPVLVVLTLALSFAGYEGVRRVALLRPWFGLARRRPSAPLAAAPA